MATKPLSEALTKYRPIMELHDIILNVIRHNPNPIRITIPKDIKVGYIQEQADTTFFIQYPTLISNHK